MRVDMRSHRGWVAQFCSAFTLGMQVTPCAGTGLSSNSFDY